MTAKVLTKAPVPCAVNEEELLRYAGAKEATLSHDVMLSVIEQYLPKLTYRAAYTELDVSISGNTVDLGAFSVKSKTLARSLSGCHKVILVAATVGSAIDREISALSLVSPAKAHMLDALGSERVESLLNSLTEELRRDGKELSPRVSAGYGDIPLELQRDIFRVLEPECKIGLYLTPSLLMSPMKSVTAFIGIKNNTVKL